MQATYVQRLRLLFSKGGPARYISHLDLARTLERALNRARIPVSYSQGFNRRPRMQLAAALPLGYTSDCELADIWLDESMEPEHAHSRLMDKMAPGIVIHSVQDIPLTTPNLQTMTHHATFQATLLDPVETAELQQQIDAICQAESVIRIRVRKNKRKEYDLRPLILDLQLDRDARDRAVITMQLYLQEGKNGRPDEVLLELGLDPLNVWVHRSQISLLDVA